MTSADDGTLGPDVQVSDQAPPEQDTAAGVQPDAIPVSFGERLRHIRKEQGQSVADVARQLNLTSTTVRRIESGSWEELGPAVYGRGYVAAYARKLDQDPAETDGYFGQSEVHRLEQEMEVLSARPRPSAWWRYQRVLTYVAATALLAIPLVTWLSRAFQPMVAPVPVAETGAESGDSMEPRETVVVDEPLLAAMTPIPDLSVASSVPETVAPPLLVLEFRERAWLEATTASGEKLAYGLMEAGTRQELDASAGLSVRLGNADGVSVELMGKPYDLSSFIRQDLAEFDIEPQRQ